MGICLALLKVERPEEFYYWNEPLRLMCRSVENCLITADGIHGEIGEVAAGKIPGRQSGGEVTFFKSVGVAVQDVAVAGLVLRQAAGLNLGIEVTM